MVDQIYIKTSIFSSYDGRNLFIFEFSVKDDGVTNTLEIQTDLKKIVKNALEHFREYNIPKLKCELLGHHLENPYWSLYDLGNTPLDAEIHMQVSQHSNPGKKPPSVRFTREQKRVKVDIVDKIRRELARFPPRNFFKTCV